MRPAIPIRNVKQRGSTVLYVSHAPSNRARGILRFRGFALPVALGRSGILANKREGDGGSPRGRFGIIRLWWRADRLPRPATRLPARPIGPRDAWCEDPRDRRYNRPIRIPDSATGDRLRREDALYDLVIELDHNTRPRVAGRGSAVFIHVARPGFLPTAGCVALDARALSRLLPYLDASSRIEIG